MNAFLKQPDEIETVSMDYTKRLSSTETISSISVTVATLAGVDVTSSLLSASTYLGVYGYARIRGGTNNTDYKITMKVTTSESNLYEEDVIMKVRSI